MKLLYKFILSTFLLVSCTLFGDSTWIGNDPGVSNPPWGDPASWTDGVPTSTDIAIFPDVFALNFLNPTIDSPPNRSVLGIRFTASTGANNYNIRLDNFRTLTVGTQGITNPGGLAQAFSIQNGSVLNINGPVDSSLLTFTAAYGTINFLGQSVCSAGTYILNGSDASSLSTLHFGGQSTFTGGTVTANQFGRVTFDGSSTLTAGTFTLGTSGTDGAIMTLDVDGTIGSGVQINTSNRAQILFSTANQLTFNGVITGATPVVGHIGISFDGGGTVLFTSDSSSYGGNSIIQDATLILTGTLGGNLTVSSAGSLEGNGRLVGNMNLQGIISPVLSGHATTLAVGGTFAGPGTYEPLLESPESHSLFTVDSLAFIGDTHLNVHTNYLTGLTPNRVLIMTAGTLAGTFETVTSDVNNPLVRVQAVYEGNSAYVLFDVPFAFVAENSNQEDVLNALSSIVDPTPDQLAVLNALIGLPVEDVPNALDQMSGQQYTSFVGLAYGSWNRFSNRLRMASRSRVECPQCCHPDTFFWIDAGGGRSNYSGDSFADGLDTRYGSIAGGVQLYSGTCWTLGIAGYYEYDNIDFDLNGSADVKNYQGAIYSGCTCGCGYALANFIYGYNQFKMKRAIEFGDIDRTAKGNGKVYNTSFYGEAGLTDQYGCISMQQYLGFDIGYYKQKGLRENNADSLNLEIGGVHKYLYDAVVGARFLWNLSCNYTAELDIDYKHRFGTDRISIDAQFVDIDVPMKIKGFKLGRNAVEGTFTFLGHLSKNLQWYVKANGECWTHYKDYNGTIGLIFHW